MNNTGYWIPLPASLLIRFVPGHFKGSDDLGKLIMIALYQLYLYCGMKEQTGDQVWKGPSSHLWQPKVYLVMCSVLPLGTPSHKFKDVFYIYIWFQVWFLNSAYIMLRILSSDTVMLEQERSSLLMSNTTKSNVISDNSFLYNLFNVLNWNYYNSCEYYFNHNIIVQQEP